MLATLISFLGGTAFRLVFGSVMDFFNKRQEHANELAMLQAQSGIETIKHTQEMERIKLQSELGIKEIQVAADAAEQKSMADAFVEAVKATQQKTGIPWADAWNAIIRPSGATVSLIAWVASIVVAGCVLGERDWTLISAFLGVFVGDRIHVKGKLV